MGNEEKLSIDGGSMTKGQLMELAEVFLLLEKWQNELDLKQQKENQHLNQRHSPTELHRQDSQKLS